MSSAGCHRPSRPIPARNLQRCGDCRNDLAELEGLPRLLDLVAQEPAQPPPSLRDRVVAAAPHPRSKRWLAVAAAALVIAVAAGLSGGPAQGPPPDSLVLALRASEGFPASGTAAFQTTGDRLRVDIALQGLERWSGEPPTRRGWPNPSAVSSASEGSGLTPAGVRRLASPPSPRWAAIPGCGSRLNPTPGTRPTTVPPWSASGSPVTGDRGG